jgi:hypothetical protein
MTWLERLRTGYALNALRADRTVESSEARQALKPLRTQYFLEKGTDQTVDSLRTRQTLESG